MGLFENAATAIRSALATSPALVPEVIGTPVRRSSIVRASGSRPPVDAEALFGIPRNKFWAGVDQALNADPRTALAAFRRAESGYTADQIRLFKSTRMVDSRLNKVAATRVQTLAGRPLIFKAPPGYETDDGAKDIAVKVTRLWHSIRSIDAAVQHLAHGSLDGFAWAELRWYVDPLSGYFNAAPVWRHPDRLAFNDDAEPCLHDGVGNGLEPLSRFPDRVMFFAPVAGQSDYPWRRGALRTRIIPSIMKRFTGRAWAVLIERWGQPQVAIFSDDDQDGADSDLAALRALGVDWRARFGANTKIEAIPVSVSDSLHKTFIDMQNTEDAIAILGQNLSTEVKDGGSYAAASAHNRVRMDILQGDAMELAEVITDQWAALICKYNGWPIVPVAEFVIQQPRELGVAEWERGLFDRDTVAQSMGYGPEADGKGSRYYIAQPTVGGIPGAPPGQTPSAITEPAKPSDTGEPGANAVDAPASDAPLAEVVAPEVTPDAAGAAPVEKAADAALNGAQIDALKGIINDVAQGLIPRATGIALITAGFPIDSETAEKIMGDVGQGFVPRDPKAAPPAAAPPGAA